MAQAIQTSPLKDIEIRSDVVVGIDKAQLLSDMLADGIYIEDADVTVVRGNIRVLSGGYMQSNSGEVYNFSGKNSFLQAEEAFSGAGVSYGPAVTGSKGYCILSVIGAQNALKLSGDVSMLAENKLCSYSIACWENAATEFATIDRVEMTDLSAGVAWLITDTPISVTLAGYLNKTEEENIAKFHSDDNAFYCPRNPLIGNQVVYNFYANHAEGGSTRAIGKYSHAEGRATTSDVRYSHAEGSFTFAGGMCSHAEGNYSVAHGHTAHAEGNKCVADGSCSHAAGSNANALAANQWVWSGNGSYGKSLSGVAGSFCINPKDGLSGFYVGQKSMYQHLAEFGAATVKADLKECLDPLFEGGAPGANDFDKVVSALSAIWLKVR